MAVYTATMKTIEPGNSVTIEHGQRQVPGSTSGRSIDRVKRVSRGMSDGITFQAALLDQQDVQADRVPRLPDQAAEEAPDRREEVAVPIKE
ncbi:MAG: hypothetical protein ACREDR_34485 [Blastocatellia bacterium]